MRSNYEEPVFSVEILSKPERYFLGYPCLIAVLDVKFDGPRCGGNVSLHYYALLYISFIFSKLDTQYLDLHEYVVRYCVKEAGDLSLIGIQL
jgi:hypothetical protein